MSENKINQNVPQKTIDETLRSLDELEMFLPLLETSKPMKLSQNDISRLRELIANYRKLKSCDEPTRRNFCVIHGVPPTMENYTKMGNEIVEFIKECLSKMRTKNQLKNEVSRKS